MAIELQAENLTNPPSAGIFLEAVVPDPEINLFARTFHRFSERFHEVHEDMIVDNVANILLVGINERGELIDIDQKTTEDTLSVIFDCRQKDAGTFGWQVSRANKSGRSIEQLYTDGRELKGNRYRLDLQGKLSGTSALDQLAAQELARNIRRLAAGREVLDQSAEIIKRQEAAARVYGDYIIKFARKLDIEKSYWDKHITEARDLEKQYKETGFMAMRPYAPSKA